MRIHPSRGPAAFLALLACSVAPVTWADSLSPEAAQLFTMTPFATGLGDLTDFRFLPDGRVLIAEKGGRVVVREEDGTLVTSATLAVDTESEKGLLGVEVDPGFEQNGFVYLYYSCAQALGAEPCDDDNRHRVSRFVLASDGTIDLNSETLLVRGLRGPENHDGGALAIGPDGKLYIGVGDTGCNSAQPPGQNITNWFGTCLTNANGKILRVNLDGTVPADNPLVAESGVTACGATCSTQPDPANLAAPRTDIWAWGLRNPWRMWFDPQTGNLWVGDVGEVTFEELSIVTGGKHYGWPFREGGQGQDAGTCATMTPQSGDCVDPVYFCRHGPAADGIDGDCTSINGGVIVDSCRWPAPWRGRLYFGDNANGRLWSLALNDARSGPLASDAGVSPRGDLGVITGGLPVSFQLGPEGDLYVGVFDQAATAGRIVQVSPIAPETCPVTDGGVPGDGGTGADGGAGTDGGGGGPTTIRPGGGGGGGGFEEPGTSSCGCAAGWGASGAGLLWAFVALAAHARRRRR